MALVSRLSNKEHASLTIDSKNIRCYMYIYNEDVKSLFGGRNWRGGGKGEGVSVEKIMEAFHHSTVILNRGILTIV